SINITVVDSLPIMLTKASRAYKCKIANNICSVGYCSSKETYYYGLKFHLIAIYKNQKLATPKIVKITKASTHDLNAINPDILTQKHTKFLPIKLILIKIQNTI
ncbi:MAG: hypothetical protein ACKPKO_19415, partial [Candidatus Fonsibacter sp.]